MELTVTVNDFYRNLATSLGAQAAYRKTENFYAIQNEIQRLSVEKKKTPVIIIDEANYISNAVLNDLKILFNFERDSRDLAVVLLVGLPPAEQYPAACHTRTTETENRDELQSGRPDQGGRPRVHCSKAERRRLYIAGL